MQSRIFMSLITVIIISLSCGRKTAQETSSPNPTTPQAPPATEQSPPAGQPDAGTITEGKVWTLMSYGARSALQMVPSGVSVTLQMDLARDAVAGNGGCNRYTGSLTSTGSGYRIDNIAATRMACPGPAMEIEEVFFQDLRKVTSYSFQGGRLIMEVEEGRQLVFYNN